MPEPALFLVENMASLQRALRKADREIRLGIRAEFRALAEPVRQHEQELALTRIRNMPGSPRWARVRVGVTSQVLYTVPGQKGVRGRSPRRRPNLADLLADRAVEPTRRWFEPRAEREVEQLLDRIAREFNRGGF
jgi:hypothetical protein